MPWEILVIPLSANLQVRVLVRYETHGGQAHKHARWPDPRRHLHPKGWTGDNRMVNLAIADLKARYQEYRARYDAWTNTN